MGQSGTFSVVMGFSFLPDGCGERAGSDLSGALKGLMGDKGCLLGTVRDGPLRRPPGAVISPVSVARTASRAFRAGVSVFAVDADFDLLTALGLGGPAGRIFRVFLVCAPGARANGFRFACTLLD